jgi:ABC-type Fe3+/spermidine/putrescine transport system ATPase subunit
LFPHLTVRQNVEYGLMVRRTDPAERNRRVKEMLALVQLEQMSGHYPRYLSGGQQQRVALARALILHPRLLLLDEPLGALDAKLREQMQIVLKDLQRALGIAFIHVTHDQNEAMALSDRIVVMRDGKIMQTGYPGDLYHYPHNSFVADFLGSTNLIKGTCIDQRNQQVDLQIAGGVRLTGQTALNFASGDSVFLSVRPQSLNITRSSAENEHTNQFLLRVTSLVYRGEQWLVLGQKGDLNLISLISEKYAASLNLRAGDEVYFSWHANDGWLMKA